MAKKYQKLLSVSLFLLGVFFCASSASAFSISPVRVVMTIDPGSEQSFSMRLSNDDDAPQEFNVIVAGIRQGPDGGISFEKGIDLAEQWVQPDTRIARLGQGGTKQIIFNIKVPRGAAPGNHYLGVGVEPAGSASGQVNLSAQAFSIVNLQVAGEVRESLKIDKFDFSGIVNGAFGFSSVLKNTGNVELAVQVNLDIFDFKGEPVGRGVQVDELKVLSGAIRRLNLDSGLAEIVWPGRYQARLSAHYGLAGQTVIAVDSFWYAPKGYFIGIAVIGLFVLTFLILKIRRKRGKYEN